MTDTLDLDALFKEARAALRGQKVEIAKKKERSKTAPEADIPDTAGIYRNPDNWIKGRGIALIHKVTETLLGNFVEYKHRTVRDARRLVREDNPPPVQAVEYIDLDLTMTNGQSPVRRAWKETRLTRGYFYLVSFQAAVEVDVFARFGEGDLVSLELADELKFKVPGGFIQFPAGTNILPELTPLQISTLLVKLNQPISCQ